MLGDPDLKETFARPAGLNRKIITVHARSILVACSFVTGEFQRELKTLRSPGSKMSL